MTDARRQLPSVDRLLREPGIAALLQSTPRNAVLTAVRSAIDTARDNRAGLPEDWTAEVLEHLQTGTARSLRPVINATGVVLHTNLGRAPLAPSAIAAMAAVAQGYSTLEFDLGNGTRGHRADHCRELLATLTGAEDALVVNNAAGALVLALNALAAGRPVLISRGELIEIGGSFRIPDIIAKSGAVLREVGTTNRTHPGDYEAAFTDGSVPPAAILTVHRSNFEQRGFVFTPEPAALAALAATHGIPFIHDVGSGLLADLAPYGLVSEPRVADAVATGAGLVIFSGDKLLGGPQAGCIVGQRTHVAALRENSFARAMRADKFTLAALEATLALYRDPEKALREIPVLRMLALHEDVLRERAVLLATVCPPNFAARLAPGDSAVGGGAFPVERLPTTLVSLAPGADGANHLALRLRQADPPIIARVVDDRVVLDPRTMAVEEFEAVGRALRGLQQEQE